MFRKNVQCSIASLLNVLHLVFFLDWIYIKIKLTHRYMTHGAVEL